MDLMRDWTEKARIPSNNAENDSQGTRNVLCKTREASVLLESKHTNLHQRRSQNLLVHLLRRILQYIFRFIKEIGWMWNRKKHSQKDAHCFTFSKKMIVLLRHGTLLREKRWSSGILEIESRIYVELLTVTTFNSSIMVKSLGNWRRTQEEIQVLY